MKHAKAAQTTPSQPALPMRRPALTRWVRWAVNLWLVYHFTGVLAAAASAGPTSNLIVAVWNVFRPYLLVLYLNHGYSFYAPQPIPTTLLDFQAHRPDGTVIRGRIPDRSIKPRLLYHRYLLLTEHITAAPADLQDQWFKSYARHLCHKHGAAKVSLTRVTHYPATMEMIRNGAGLSEPFSFEEMPAGEFSCGDF
jgi:hypothetical protein